jgi:hypothetical protein
METSVVVALVSGAISLVVAGGSLVASWITSRTSAKNSRGLEGLKYSFAESTKAQEIADREFLAALDATKESMQAIQQMKEETQLLLSAIDTSLGSDEAVARMSDAREALMVGYKNHHPILSETEAQALHRAKELARVAEELARKALSSHRYASELDAQTRQVLADVREQLTEQQNLLRDSRMERLVRRTMSGGPHGARSLG